MPFSLSAPAAYWIALGRPEPLGWVLWVLVWAEAVAMIVYTYLRLAQRTLQRPPAPAERLRMGWGSLLIAAANLGGAVALSLADVVPRWLSIPYAFLCAEVLWGVFRPAAGLKPAAIGYRQLAVTAAYTILFILTWRL